MVPPAPTFTLVLQVGGVHLHDSNTAVRRGDLDVAGSRAVCLPVPGAVVAAAVSAAS